MTEFTFLDCSGVGNSGKSAAVDFLREVNGIYAQEYWFEFDIIRAPDGLLNLRHSLFEDWSPVRSGHSIRAFLNVADRMGCDPRPWDIRGLMRSTGQRYDRYFNHEFTTATREFANSFISAHYRAKWPYNALRSAPPLNFLRKLLRRAGLCSDAAEEVLVADGQDFDAKANELLRSLYRPIVPVGTQHVILNNGFEPFNPIPGLDMLPGAKQIVVIRDPRDVFVSGSNSSALSAEDRHLAAGDKNYGRHSTFLATSELKTFVERQRVYHRRLYSGTDPRVLRIRLEDLVCDYAATTSRILAFLGIPPERHRIPRKHFDPERSRKNVGMWRTYSRQADIEFIAASLPELLVEP